MFQSIRIFLTLIVVSTMALADVFMTELTDAQDASTAGKYVELYNNGDSDVDLSSGWTVQRWTNGNDTPTASSIKSLTGTIAAAGFYIICNDADKILTTYGITCDQDIGTGGFADSNGDDNMAILLDGEVVDIFGVPGEDGSGTSHEFEDGRAERAADCITAQATYSNECWNTWCDSNNACDINDNQNADEGFDPGAWIGATSGGDDGGVTTCDDATACNDGATGDCEFVNINWGNLQWPYSTTVDAGSDSEGIYGQVYVPGVTGSGSSDSGVVAELGYGADGSTADDTWTWVAASVNGNSGDNDEFGASLNIADAGTYSYSYRYRYGSSCWYYASEVGTATVNALTTYDVTFSVNMSYAGDIDTENGVRIFGLAGWSSDDAVSIACEENVCAGTVALTAGDYQYKYRNGWSYESVDNLSCASESGGYWNRDLSVSADTVLDTVCFGACSDCVAGCMDSNATNYNESANTDDDSCEYPSVDPDNIFFSEYGEGSGYNKYLEIYNATDASVDLGGYQRVNCSNGCDDWEYYTDFADGASIAAGDVYVICDTGIGDDFPSSECDESAALYFNGDDAQGIWHVASSAAIDVIGAIGDDPGSGWEVAGVNNGTKDHSLVRDASVTSGNALWFDNDTETGSAGTEWVVLDQNTWAFIGSHPHDFASTCDDDTACNYGDTADCTFPQEGFDCDGNVLVDVTFNVDMSEQTVDTEGYGLSLVLNGYHSMSDDDGDGVWSATLTLVAETTYSYKYKNGDAWETNFNDLGCGDGGTYGDRFFTTAGEDQSLDAVCFDSCSACITCSYDGNVNGDDVVNVSDVVMIVGWIIGNGTADACTADVNEDGVVNVSDVVMIVGWIIGGRADIDDATNANIVLSNNNISIEANGQVSGVQMTLSHGNDFSIDLADAYISEYSTNGNITKLVVVSANSSINHVASCKGSFNVDSAIVVNSNQEIADVNILNLEPVELTLAGPNPFNPTTSLNVVVANDGYVSVNVYNITGQHIATLLNGYMDANTSGYMVNWNASNLSSGVYLVRAETAGSVSTQKLMLLK